MAAVASWTPGPWKRSGNVGAAEWITTAEPGADRRIAQICTVYGPNVTPGSAANAALIAETPELADIVHALCVQFGCAGVAAVENSNDPTEALHFRALRALARARGEG